MDVQLMAGTWGAATASRLYSTHDHEREITSYLLTKQQKTFEAASDGGRAATLMSRGIVRIAGQKNQHMDMNHVPMIIPDHLRSTRTNSPIPRRPPVSDSRTPGAATGWSSTHSALSRSLSLSMVTRRVELLAEWASLSVATICACAAPANSAYHGCGLTVWCSPLVAATAPTYAALCISAPCKVSRSDRSRTVAILRLRSNLSHRA